MKISRSEPIQVFDKPLSVGDEVEFVSRYANDTSESAAFWQDYNNGKVTLLLQKTKHLWSVRAQDGMIFYAFDDEFTREAVKQ